MTLRIVGPDAEAALAWAGVAAAIEAGHRLPPAEIADNLLRRGPDTLLSRSAWIDGMGLLVKTATVFPGNAALGLPGVNGAATLFSDRDGRAEALVDFHLLTKWKTAGDSLLAARLLARPESREILIVGAGTVARSMIAAYASQFPDARFSVWSRRAEAAMALAGEGVTAVRDLEEAVRRADIVCTATMSATPLVKGEWLRPGTHLDLIGAYRPDMREVDDTVLHRARIFVDSRRTTLEHIGELCDPIHRGVIAVADVRGDFHDIVGGGFRREGEAEITLCKNGGGAHLDLMTADWILRSLDGAA